MNLRSYHNTDMELPRPMRTPDEYEPAPINPIAPSSNSSAILLLIVFAFGAMAGWVLATLA